MFIMALLPCGCHNYVYLSRSVVDRSVNVAFSAYYPFKICFTAIQRWAALIFHVFPLLIVFKINLFETFVQKYQLSVQRFVASNLCPERRVRPGSNLFTKIMRRLH